MTRKTFHIVPLSVPASGQVSIDFYTKIEHERIIGLFFHGAGPFTNSTCELFIDGHEVMPQDMPVFPFVISAYKNLQEAVLPINELAGGTKVEGTYKSGAGAQSVKLVLLVEYESE